MNDIEVPHDHSEVCRYLGSGCGTRSFVIRLRGNDRVASVPYCRRIDPCQGWCDSKKQAIRSIGAFLGLAVCFDDALGEWREDDSVVRRAWNEACRQTVPFAHWHSNDHRDAWLVRDVARTCRRLFQRERCGVCGRMAPRHIKNDNQHTYLITDGTFLKIGVSRCPSQRLYDLRISNPRNLKIVAELCGGSWERRLHLRFSRWRIGGEWFRDKPEIREAFGLRPGSVQPPLFYGVPSVPVWT